MNTAPHCEHCQPEYGCFTKLVGCYKQGTCAPTMPEEMQLNRMKALWAKLLSADKAVQKVRDEINYAMLHPIRGPRNKLQKPNKKSIYSGQTWTAYRIGEDRQFPNNYVTRDAYGNLCSCVNTRTELVANARLCKVKLHWRKAT